MTRAIFGFGYMRSGTTLLYNILKLHPAIFTAAAEPKLIDTLPIIKQTYKNLFDDKVLLDYLAYIANVARFGESFKYLRKPLIENDDFTFSDLENLIATHDTHDYLQLINIVYVHLALRKSKENWYVKSQVVYFEEILRSLPDSIFLEIVRDPRDVIATKKKDKESIWNSLRYPEEKRALKNLALTYDPVWDSLSWRTEIIAGMKLKAKYPEKIFSVRYEDLVQNPVKKIKQICSFLEIEFFDTLLEVPRRNSSNWEYRPRGIGSESISKWKSILTPEEVIVCQQINTYQMQYFGYEVQNYQKHHNIKTMILYLKSFPELFERILKRFKLGGFRLLINVLLLYIKKLKNVS